MDKAASDLFTIKYLHSVNSGLSSIGVFSVISCGLSSGGTKISTGSGELWKTKKEDFAVSLS